MSKQATIEKNTLTKSPGDRPYRIFYTLLVVLLLAGVVPLSFFGYKMININREELKTNQRSSQLTVARSFSDFISEYLQRQSKEIESLASGLSLGMQALSPEEFLERVRDRKILNAYLERNPEAQKVVILNSSLVGWYESKETYSREPKIERLLTTIAHENTNRKTSTGAYPSVQSDPVYMDGGRRCGIVFSSPIVDEGEYLGVISSFVTLEPVQRMVAEKSEQLYEVYILDDRRRLLAYSELNVGESLENPNLTDSEIVDYYFRNRDAGAQTISFTAEGPDGTRHMVGSYAFIPSMPCGVFLQVEYHKAYHSVLLMRSTTIKWILGSLAATVILCFLFARWINRPISHLTDGAMRLAAGDFSHKINIRSRNEIGQLAGSFNFMSEEIERHVERIKQAAKENEELFYASIRMLTAAIDEKDPYTRGHSQRVTQYSITIARNMGLAEKEIEKIELAALLHDVGKIGIDDAVLKKPGLLTEGEYEIMKQHPEKGAVIMSPVKQLSEIIPTMRYHHERVNGTGYPAGLKGHEIPLSAQILSVADTFDAMTTERPYQQPMSPDYVAGKIESWSNIRFDERVVNGFLRAFKKGELHQYIPVKSDAGAEEDTEITRKALAAAARGD